MGAEILDVSDRLLVAALNGIYQGIIITVLVALSLRVFKRTNAATRHAVWLCTLLLLVLIIVAHCFVDARPRTLKTSEIAENPAPNGPAVDSPSLVSLATTIGGARTAVESSRLKLANPLPAATEQIPGLPESKSTGWSDELRTVGSFQPSLAAFTEADPITPPISAEPTTHATAGSQSGWIYSALRRLANPVSVTHVPESRAARIAGRIALGVCLALTGLRLLTLLLRLHQIRRLKLHSVPASEPLDKLFRDLVARLELRRKVTLRTSPTSRSSFLLGFFHPVILLPNEEQTDAEEAEQVLRHELAHVCRCDDWANLLQHFILAAFPFHPAVWWISKKLSLEREIACDDYVLQSSARPQTYALLLANLASRMQRCPPLLAPGAFNNKTQLQQRIDMILNTRRNASPRLAATWLTIMASATALFAAAAICLAPRIVLAQSDKAPARPNDHSEDAAELPLPVPVTVTLASPSIALVATEPAPGNAIPTTTQPAVIVAGPKIKSDDSQAVTWQPVVVVPAVPGGAVTPAALVPPSPQAPRPARPPSAVSITQPRSGQPPRAARADSADSSLEERLRRLERMVESLLDRGQGDANAYNLKQPDGGAAIIDRKEIARIEAHAKHQADIARKHAMNPDEIEKIKEHAQREAARAADQAKQAAKEMGKLAKTEKMHQTKRDLKEGSKKQLDVLRKQLEVLEHEREKLDRQIEELERNQELLESQEEDVDALFDETEANPEALETKCQ